MKHFGDIAKLSGYELPIVDVITGGSPCQDLSVAGKRAGLAGERSGLFMEQIRIVKEMRERDRRDNGRSGWAVRPRYCVWENVCGAFSSNKGKDFQAVLTEFVKVADPEAPDVPMPDRGGWPKCGFLYDALGRWSVAWRTHDAQYFGVPQRRKRICVLADFNGLSAGEILFDPQYERTTANGEPLSTVGYSGNVHEREIQAVSESVPGNIEQSGTTGQRTSCGAESSTDSAICLQGNGIDRSDTAGCNGAGWRRGGSYTLNTIDRPAVFNSGTTEGMNIAPSVMCGNPWDSQSERVYHGDGAWHSLNANESGGQSRDAVLAFSQNQREEVRELGDCAGSVSAKMGIHQQTFVKAFSFDSMASNSMKSANPHSGCREVETAKTLDCFDPNPSKNQGGDSGVSCLLPERS